jgi:hypothetical protein
MYTTAFVIYTGTESSSGVPSLRIAVPEVGYSETMPPEMVDIFQIVDRGSTGDLSVSGDVIVGSLVADTTVPQKKVLCTSNFMASMSIQSGDFDHAILELQSGPDKDAQVLLSQADGKGFNLVLDGVQNGETKLSITDSGDVDSVTGDLLPNALMMMITDVGLSGDIHVTGNAIFGTEGVEGGEVRPNSLSINGGEAHIFVTAGRK